VGRGSDILLLFGLAQPFAFYHFYLLEVEMAVSLERGTIFIWQNARLLERAIFSYRFYDGSPATIVRALQAYQNDDGGFGHALEPDLRAPESQALYTGFALNTLYECNLREPALASRACEFVASHADLTAGIPMIIPSSANYPRATHWNNPASARPSLQVLVGLVGMLNWQGISNPWLNKAVGACLEYIATTPYNDAHEIQTAFALLESLPQDEQVARLYAKFARELVTARFFIREVPITTYGLTPLEYAPTPDSYCRRLFSADQIESHLVELASQQQEDGGWPINWEPPSEMARLEWRARKTVQALSVLRAYGRI
jgi:hypothetical protein